MALFDKEYKIMAVKRVEESGRPAVEIARELDLKPNTLYDGLKNMVSMGTMLFLAVVVYMKKMRNFESYVENC